MWTSSRFPRSGVGESIDPMGERHPSLDAHGRRQTGARVVQGSGQPTPRRRHRVTPPLSSLVYGYEDELSSYRLPSSAGGFRNARLATLRTMAWTADRDISHLRLTAVTPDRCHRGGERLLVGQPRPMLALGG